MDGICFHPYTRPANGVPSGWELPEIDQAVRDAHGIAHLPVWVTEYGLPLQVTDEGQVQADFIRESTRLLGHLSPDELTTACYFSWNDKSGGHGGVFGLVRAADTRRLGAGTFANLAGGTVLA